MQQIDNDIIRKVTQAVLDRDYPGALAVDHGVLEQMDADNRFRIEAYLAAQPGGNTKEVQQALDLMYLDVLNDMQVAYEGANRDEAAFATARQMLADAEAKFSQTHGYEVKPRNLTSLHGGLLYRGPSEMGGYIGTDPASVAAAIPDDVGDPAIPADVPTEDEVIDDVTPSRTKRGKHK